MEDNIYQECDKRYELEQKIKQVTNSARKEVQRELDKIKNRHFGPIWAKAWSDYHTLKTLKKEKEEIEKELAEFETYQNNIQPSINFLYEIGYLKRNIALELTNDDLTLKGTLATEINEGHQILMTELYTQELAHNMSGDDLITILACFLTDNKDTDENPSIYNIHIPQEVRVVLLKLNEIAMKFQRKEEEIGYPVFNYWNISTKMIEPLRRWIQGENASVICTDHEIFEGNFIRSVMRLTNMLDEWLSLATYCQHTEQIDKILEVRQRMIRDVIVSDSLYLHL